MAVETGPRIFCIGRNYRDHAREMGGEAPAEPVVFMKPATSLVPVGEPIRMPAHGAELHHEAELVLRLGRAGRPAAAEAPGWIEAVTLGIDLTLRDVQAELKRGGLPWERAKAFDGSAPVGAWVDREEAGPLEEIEFELAVDDEVRQRGRVGDMVFPPSRLLEAIGVVWELRPGDLVYTGTPAGVGPLRPGQRVEVSSPAIGRFAWEVRSTPRSSGTRGPCRR